MGFGELKNLIILINRSLCQREVDGTEKATYLKFGEVGLLWSKTNLEKKKDFEILKTYPSYSSI